MDYEIVKKINIDKSKCRKIGGFWYDPEIDGLYHESPWPFPVQLMISRGLTKCHVTPGFLELPFIMKGWINFDLLLREIDLLNLIKEGKILMHGSCAGRTLIVGLPQSGKTYQAYYLRTRGHTLFSEEYTIIQGVDAFPYNITTKSCFSVRTIYDCDIPMSLFEWIKLLFATIRAKIFPFMHEAVIWKRMKLSGRPSRINKIVYGSSGREVMDWKEFAILCENEFPFMANEFLQAYAVATGFDLIGLQEKQRRLIKEFVDAVTSHTK